MKPGEPPFSTINNRNCLNMLSVEILAVISLIPTVLRPVVSLPVM